MKYRTSTRSCLVLFLLTFCTAIAADDPARIVLLEARDASTEDGIRLLEDPERLGFAELHRKAKWRLNDVAPGFHDLDLTYSSGSGPEGQHVGTVLVEVGKARFTVPIDATGGWSKTRIISLEHVAIEEGGTNLTVSVTQRATGVQTVLDLWSADLTPWKMQGPDAGKVLMMRTPHGRYVQYVSRTLREPVALLVLVHGTPGGEDSALGVAEGFVADFIPCAKARGLILVAPAFDQRNFGGRSGPGGGYRGLFGREIGAGRFVNEIVARYEARLPTFDGTFYLYGHSAGGQFVSRYAVMHPRRLKAAVISAAGSYAFPNPRAVWADGMQPLQRTMTWEGDDEAQPVDIRPDANGWLEAAQLPVTVLVGARDDTARVQGPPQSGTSMQEMAEGWVEQMNALAALHGKAGRARLVIVPGAGHDSRALLPSGIRALFGE